MLTTFPSLQKTFKELGYAEKISLSSRSTRPGPPNTCGLRTIEQFSNTGESYLPTLNPPFLANGLLLPFSTRLSFSEEKTFFAPGLAHSTIEAADVPACTDSFWGNFFGWESIEDCDSNASRAGENTSLGIRLSGLAVFRSGRGILGSIIAHVSGVLHHILSMVSQPTFERNLLTLPLKVWKRIALRNHLLWKRTQRSRIFQASVKNWIS